MMCVCGGLGACAAVVVWPRRAVPGVCGVPCVCLRIASHRRAVRCACARMRNGSETKRAPSRRPRKAAPPPVVHLGGV